MEVLLRKLIPALKLYNIPIIIFIYEKYALFRYWFQFNKLIEFRGASFVIGKDVTLFPSVFLGTYEKCELDILLSHKFRENLVFWDIGANVGLYSVLFARKYPQSQVISFEPNSRVHSLLINNFRYNNIENARLERCALSNFVGDGILASSEKRAGAARLASSPGSSSRNNTFPIITGDGFLLQNQELTPDFIKIDVEGHEPEVIEGIQRLLKSHKPVLTLEVFKNLWESDRGDAWVNAIETLFSIYGNALLITDAKNCAISDWNSELLTGGMQTLIFGINQKVN